MRQLAAADFVRQFDLALLSPGPGRVSKNGFLVSLSAA
jgi:hypothetical protein